jgi:putative transposase
VKQLFQSMLVYLAAATDRELAHQVQHFKIVNEILRKKLPRRIQISRYFNFNLLSISTVLRKRANHELLPKAP